jgi:hypothetical protein
VDDAQLPVDVAALERDLLLQPEACAGGDDRDRTVTRPELCGDELELLYAQTQREWFSVRWSGCGLARAVADPNGAPPDRRGAQCPVIGR